MGTCSAETEPTPKLPVERETEKRLKTESRIEFLDAWSPRECNEFGFYGNLYNGHFSR